ncbi:MAG: PAS domain S-box protein [Desulfobacteraceae bacterium]|nr:MAG: PAS domain S-box protein [Desulfobacteraceae bacterium]
MQKMHSLLKRQLKHYFKNPYSAAGDLSGFIEDVNKAYLQSDDDRNMLERSLDLSSKELLQANAELNSIFQVFPDLFFRLDHTGAILDFKGGRTMDLYIQPERLIGKYIYDIPIKEIGKKFQEAIEETLKSNAMVSMEYSIKGEKLENHYEARLLPASDRQIIAVIRNITKRKTAEETLKESEERYRQVLEFAPDPIVVYDHKGIITYINPAFTRVFGWKPEEILFKKLDHVPEKYRQAERLKLEQVKRGESFSGFETCRSTKDGVIIHISMSAAVWRDHDGHWAGSVITLRDITEQKRLGQELNHAQKMKAIGTLAGGIAHDFNNLLTGIQGNASLMLLDFAEDRIHHENLKHIEEYVKRGAELTRQLLGFSLSGKYEVRPTDLNELVEKNSKMFGRTRKEITIHRYLQNGVWPVEVDPGQIEQVLLNMYVNAWQAMPDGGDLYLHTENVFLDEKMLKPYELKAGRYVRIAITDTGIGMDETVRSRVFDPFFTTKEMGKGTGLGLSSAYGIIKNHNGFIKVDSEPGKGTTFTIYLPISEKGLSKEVPLPAQIFPGQETILLVDDEEMILGTAQSLLEKIGYQVIAAKGGREGVDVYKEQNKKIDLVILDMIMPGMGGAEVYKHLKKLRPDVKILLASGYSLNSQAFQLLKKGCQGFIQKPFTIQNLSQKIREILD